MGWVLLKSSLGPCSWNASVNNSRRIRQPAAETALSQLLCLSGQWRHKGKQTPLPVSGRQVFPKLSPPPLTPSQSPRAYSPERRTEKRKLRLLPSPPFHFLISLKLFYCSLVYADKGTLLPFWEGVVHVSSFAHMISLKNLHNPVS